MAYMIQISEDKKEQMSELCEKMLKYGGKMMQCLENLEEDDEEIGHRGYEPERDYDDMGERSRMGYRRGVKGTGRYGRYY